MSGAPFPAAADAYSNLTLEVLPTSHCEERQRRSNHRGLPFIFEFCKMPGYLAWADSLDYSRVNIAGIKKASAFFLNNSS